MSATLDPDVRRLAEGLNFAHVATIMPDGGPHSVAVWIHTQGERLVFFAQPTSQKGRNIARDPRVAISIVDHAHPYKSCRIRGRVVETVDGPPAKAVADEISMRYKGRPFRKPTTTLYLVEVDAATYTDLSKVAPAPPAASPN